ncbi:hypothetical protein ACLOAV_004448 [Pseudogymnoascus australis]
MAGKGKKGKSKGGNKPKAASQAPKPTPAVEAGAAAAAAATNSSTPIDSELITPGALDLKISDPEVAAVAGEEAGDKAAPETGAAAAASETKAVEKEEPVVAEKKVEEPIITKKTEEPIDAAKKQKDAPFVADEQRDAPIAADKQQKEAPLPAVVGAQKDVSAPAAESKQAPTIGGASAAPLAAGMAATKKDLLANNNPFIAAPKKEANPFDTPVVAAQVTDVPTLATKAEAFKDFPIQSKETAPAPEVLQPEAVPTHKTPIESANPYTQPLKTSNEAIAQPENVSSAKKVADDGFEAAPVANPTPAAATEPYPAASAVEDLKRAPVPEDKKSQSPAHTPLAAPSEFDTTPVTETTPYQPPAPAAAVPQETSATAPTTSQPQGTTTTTGATAGGRPTPSPAPAAASSSKAAAQGPDSTKPKRSPSRKESEANEFWPAMYTSSPRPEEKGGVQTKTQTKTTTQTTSSPSTTAPALASPAHIPSPIPPIRSPSPRSHGPSTPPPALANAFPRGPPAQTSAPRSTADSADPSYLPAEDTVDGFINPWSRAARLNSVQSPDAASAAASTAPSDPFATPLSPPPSAAPEKPLPRAPTHPAEKPVNTGANRDRNPFFPPSSAPESTDGESSSASAHSRIPRKPAPKKVPRGDGMDVRLEELPVGAPGARGGRTGRFPSLETRAPWGMR